MYGQVEIALQLFSWISFDSFGQIQNPSLNFSHALALGGRYSYSYHMMYSRSPGGLKSSVIYHNILVLLSQRFCLLQSFGFHNQLFLTILFIGANRASIEVTGPGAKKGFQKYWHQISSSSRPSDRCCLFPDIRVGHTQSFFQCQYQPQHQSQCYHNPSFGGSCKRIKAKCYAYHSWKFVL